MRTQEALHAASSKAEADLLTARLEGLQIGCIQVAAMKEQHDAELEAEAAQRARDWLHREGPFFRPVMAVLDTPGDVDAPNNGGEVSGSLAVSVAGSVVASAIRPRLLLSCSQDGQGPSGVKRARHPVTQVRRLELAVQRSSAGGLIDSSSH